MRKLTGYIGALIIVFALMGSILAGYALNINGSSSVINKYESVTDVSGLYTHSQEPSYIDYNPASNYIGYGLKQTDTPFTITNNTTLDSRLNYGIFTASASNCAWNTSKYTPGAFYYNGAVVPFSTSANNVGAYIYPILTGDGVKVFNKNPTADSAIVEIGIYNNGSWSRNWSNDLTFSYSNNVLTINDLQYSNTWTVSTAWIAIPYADGTYTATIGPNVGYYQLPDYGAWYDVKNGAPTLTAVYEIDGYNVLNNYTIKPIVDSWAFVKKSYDYEVVNEVGIVYTESNRVNNYLINTEPGNTVVNNATIDLMGITAGDLYPAQEERFRTAMLLDDWRSEYPDILHSRIFAPYYNMNGDYVEEQGQAIHRYSLYDVLNTYAIPSGANELVITTNSSDIRTYTYVGQNYSFDMNMCALYINDGNSINILYDVANKKDYVVYDIDNGLCKLYAYDGTLKGTGTTNQIGVIFVDNTYSLGRYEITYGDFPYTNYNGSIDMSNRARPFIAIQSTIGNPANNHYMDITKGISIKNDNVSNVVWNNEYTNGNIQLLFRAENTDRTYHNDIIVGDNTISIDYNNNGYSVTLNGGNPVAVGKWRNIVLNMDLRTGELSAIPVRTFNSYTNVVLDTASIVIGDMVNPSPTNKIEWAPTSNSLMFNIYSTAVFMNTYGVVMVNPQLDITEYFTDLNGFYRMRLYNFSVLGSSITVNGVTADVSNNSITIDEQTVQVKDMAITYADGHAYISDSNVNIDLGEVVNNNISMTGAWYFETELLKGYTSQKMVYTWDWGDFILNNTQFCIMYIGIALIGLIVARRYCSLSITDYIVLIVSFAIALTVQVIV